MGEHSDSDSSREETRLSGGVPTQFAYDDNVGGDGCQVRASLTAAAFDPAAGEVVISSRGSHAALENLPSHAHVSETVRGDLGMMAVTQAVVGTALGTPHTPFAAPHRAISAGERSGGAVLCASAHGTPRTAATASAVLTPQLSHATGDGRTDKAQDTAPHAPLFSASPAAIRRPAYGGQHPSPTASTPAADRTSRTVSCVGGSPDSESAEVTALEAAQTPPRRAVPCSPTTSPHSPLSRARPASAGGHCLASRPPSSRNPGPCTGPDAGPCTGSGAGPRTSPPGSAGRDIGRADDDQMGKHRCMEVDILEDTVEAVVTLIDVDAEHTCDITVTAEMARAWLVQFRAGRAGDAFAGLAADASRMASRCHLTAKLDNEGDGLPQLQAVVDEMCPVVGNDDNNVVLDPSALVGHTALATPIAEHAVASKLDPVDPSRSLGERIHFHEREDTLKCQHDVPSTPRTPSTGDGCDAATQVVPTLQTAPAGEDGVHDDDTSTSNESYSDADHVDLIDVEVTSCNVAVVVDSTTTPVVNGRVNEDAELRGDALAASQSRTIQAATGLSESMTFDDGPTLPPQLQPAQSMPPFESSIAESMTFDYGPTLPPQTELAQSMPAFDIGLFNNGDDDIGLSEVEERISSAIDRGSAPSERVATGTIAAHGYGAVAVLEEEEEDARVEMSATAASATLRAVASERLGQQDQPLVDDDTLLARHDRNRVAATTTEPRKPSSVRERVCLDNTADVRQPVSAVALCTSDAGATAGDARPIDESVIVGGYASSAELACAESTDVAVNDVNDNVPVRYPIPSVGNSPWRPMRTDIDPDLQLVIAPLNPEYGAARHADVDVPVFRNGRRENVDDGLDDGSHWMTTRCDDYGKARRGADVGGARCSLDSLVDFSQDDDAVEAAARAAEPVVMEQLVHALVEYARQCVAATTTADDNDLTTAHTTSAALRARSTVGIATSPQLRLTSPAKRPLAVMAAAATAATAAISTSSTAATLAAAASTRSALPTRKRGSVLRPDSSSVATPHAVTLPTNFATVAASAYLPESPLAVNNAGWTGHAGSGHAGAWVTVDRARIDGWGGDLTETQRQLRPQDATQAAIRQIAALPDGMPQDATRNPDGRGCCTPFPDVAVTDMDDEENIDEDGADSSRTISGHPMSVQRSFTGQIDARQQLHEHFVHGDVVPQQRPQDDATTRWWEVEAQCAPDSHDSTLLPLAFDPPAGNESQSSLQLAKRRCTSGDAAPTTVDDPDCQFVSSRSVGRNAVSASAETPVFPFRRPSAPISTSQVVAPRTSGARLETTSRARTVKVSQVQCAPIDDEGFMDGRAIRPIENALDRQRRRTQQQPNSGAAVPGAAATVDASTVQANGVCAHSEDRPNHVRCNASKQYPTTSGVHVMRVGGALIGGAHLARLSGAASAAVLRCHEVQLDESRFFKKTLE